jgi:nucleotide-binding universal stress UspA family protein
MRQALDRAFPQLPGQVEPVKVQSRPAEVLAAASHGAALLVVGSHERGPFGHMLTPMAGRGAAFTTCPVAVVRDGRHEHPRSGKVVVGIDDSFTAWHALRWAATEAQYRDAELKVVHVAFLRPGMLPQDLSHDEGQTLAHMLGEVLIGPLAGVTISVDPEPAYRHTLAIGGKGISPWAWSWPGRRQTRTCSWWVRMDKGTSTAWRLARSPMTAWLRQRALSWSSRRAARMSLTVPGMPSPPRSGDLLRPGTLRAAWPRRLFRT